MITTEDYCSSEISKLLKEKGFLEESKFFYPTHQRAMKWLRDEKEIYVCPKLRCFDGKQPYYKWEPTILRLPSNNIIYPQPLDMCKHYESYTEAVEAALKYTLENLI